jgi:hypothetical protein
LRLQFIKRLQNSLKMNNLIEMIANKMQNIAQNEKMSGFGEMQ